MKWFGTSIAAISTFLAILGIPEAFADKFNTETSSSIRALGMGDAVINSERGPYAVFYNPANIAAKNTGTNIQIVNVKFDFNDSALSKYASLSKPTTFSLGDLYPTLLSNTNSYIANSYSVFPNITIRNFSLGLLYEFNQGAEVRGSDQALRVRARNRFAPTAALSFRLFKGIFRFGWTSQYLNVGDADSWTPQPISGGTLDFKQFIQSGAGWAHTAGATLTFPVRYLPSFSFVARNIWNTRFDKPQLVKFGDGSTVPDMPMTYDLAAGATFYLGKNLEFHPEIDYRDGLNALNGDQLRHVFGGFELGVFETVKLRAGMAHGYLSFGFGIATRKASIDFAVYADEKDDGLRQNMDTRYAIQYTWGLFK